MICNLHATASSYTLLECSLARSRGAAESVYADAPGFDDALLSPHLMSDEVLQVDQNTCKACTACLHRWSCGC